MTTLAFSANLMVMLLHLIAFSHALTLNKMNWLMTSALWVVLSGHLALVSLPDYIKKFKD